MAINVESLVPEPEERFSATISVEEADQILREKIERTLSLKGSFRTPLFWMNSQELGHIVSGGSISPALLLEKEKLQEAALEVMTLDYGVNLDKFDQEKLGDYPGYMEVTEYRSGKNEKLYFRRTITYFTEGKPTEVHWDAIYSPDR